MKKKKILFTLCLTGLLVGSNCLGMKRFLKMLPKMTKQQFPRLNNFQNRRFDQDFWNQMKETNGYKENPEIFKKAAREAKKNINFSSLSTGLVHGALLGGAFQSPLLGIFMGIVSFGGRQSNLTTQYEKQLLEQANKYSGEPIEIETYSTLSKCTQNIYENQKNDNDNF